MEKIKEITNEDLDKIREQLKANIPNWPVVVAEKISVHKEWVNAAFKKCNAPIVYNISSGRVISQFRRRIFYVVASGLLTEVPKIEMMEC